MRHQADLDGFGTVFIETSYQNNMFQINYGNIIPGINQTENILSVTFDNGEWTSNLYVRNPSPGHYRIPAKATKEMVDVCVDYILSTKVLRNKLVKWKKDALKRLDKSVPRLKQEYEDALARQKALQNAPF